MSRLSQGCQMVITLSQGRYNHVHVAVILEPHHVRPRQQWLHVCFFVGGGGGGGGGHGQVKMHPPSSLIIGVPLV